MLALLVLALQSQVSPPVTGNGHVADSLIASAQEALAAGRPWRASRTVAPLLQSELTRTPAALLVAARAAAGWEGWATVTTLLISEPWLDSTAGGEGRALVARAMVERGDPNAVDHARRAVSSSLSPRERGERLLVLARAYDRIGRLDSAAQNYRLAAAELPLVADWLDLRAAGVLVDSAARAALFAEVRTPAARDRIRWTDALASERTGYLPRAARLYEQLGASVTALRLRASVAREPAQKAQIRGELIALLPKLSIAQVPAALTVLDGELAPLGREEDLVAARRAAAASMLERSARGFTRAVRTTPLADGDRITYGSVLARLGRHAEAITQYNRVTARDRVAEARYLRARSIWRSAGDAEGRAALRAVRDSFPADSNWAATAAWLLGDALVDEGNDSTARHEFEELWRRWPGTSQGERAAFQAGLLEFIAGDDSIAGATFDALLERRPGGSEATAAMYWSGRAWQSAGDSARGRARFQDLLNRFPQSYYVVPAARSLGVAPWTPGTGTVGPASREVTEALARAALLDSLGLDQESGYEFDRLVREPTGADAIAVARALRDAGRASLGIRVAIRVGGATPDSALLRLLYPLPSRDAFEAEARALGLSPFLMAGLVRQESLFDPAARSRADARGLMQVLPSVGASYAKREGLTEWDTILLYQPDVNIHFGLLHFAERREACGGQIEAALAAYNAGSEPVNRWLKRAGTADPEIFIERIPYIETRDYVRRVLYNEARYASLY